MSRDLGLEWVPARKRSIYQKERCKRSVSVAQRGGSGPLEKILTARRKTSLSVQLFGNPLIPRCLLRFGDARAPHNPSAGCAIRQQNESPSAYPLLLDSPNTERCRSVELSKTVRMLGPKELEYKPASVGAGSLSHMQMHARSLQVSTYGLADLQGPCLR